MDDCEGVSVEGVEVGVSVLLAASETSREVRVWLRGEGARTSTLAPAHSISKAILRNSVMRSEK